MIVIADQLTDGRYQTYCTGCSTPTDIIDGQELRGILVKNDGLYCMDCDPMASEEIHPVAWFIASVLCEHIGDSCLSSSPYLNPEQRGKEVAGE